MVWTDCLNALRDELPDNVFTLWIRPLHADVREQTLYLMAPNPYFTRHITEHFLARITTLAQQYSQGHIQQVLVQVDSRPGLSLSETRSHSAPAQSSSVLRDPAQTSRSTGRKNKANSFGRTLNPLFTFGHFVEGRSNQMAAQTCRKILTALGDAQHNPLFLYGPTGLGKTHLMHAVGHAFLRPSLMPV